MERNLTPPKQNYAYSGFNSGSSDFTTTTISCAKNSVHVHNSVTSFGPTLNDKNVMPSLYADVKSGHRHQDKMNLTRTDGRI